MLHLIEHGVKNNFPGSGADDRSNLFGALGGAAPDANLRAELGVFVAAPEPFPNAPLRASLILIHGQIDALGDAEGRWIALS